MANLSPYEPFSIEPVADLFQGLFRPMRSLMSQVDPQQIPDMKLDVTESENAYEIKAEIPGVRKEDINVQVDGNIISISATIERDREVKEGERVLRRERYAGSLQRTFSLALAVDETAAKARYENGVLELTLPKKTAGTQKRLPVE